MRVLRRTSPILFFLLAAGGAFYASRVVSLHGALGPQCELKEKFAAAGRPAYWHHCVCWGIRYNENPPPAPNADATRCFGLVRKAWVDTDEIALKEIEEQERAARSGRMFDKLPPATQEKIIAAYKRLQQGAFRHDYAYMLDQAKEILLEVDDYGETRALETAARKSLEAASRPPEAPAPTPPQLTDPVTNTGTGTSP